MSDTEIDFAHWFEFETGELDFNSTVEEWCRAAYQAGRDGHCAPFQPQPPMTITGPTGDTLLFDAPFPPTVNTYWRWNQQHRRMLISAAGRKYREAVIRAVTELRYRHRQLTGRLEVVLDLYPGDNRRRDVDNYAKAILDAITKSGLWVDDDQIDRLIIRRCEVMPRDAAKCVVMITPIVDQGG